MTRSTRTRLRARTAAGALTAALALSALTGAGSADAAGVAPDPVAQYVAKVYQDLFGRAPDPAGLAAWTSALSSGTPYGAVADAITGSQEYRTRLIAASYVIYLGHAPDAGGLAAWLEAMNRGARIEQVQAGLLGSAEYFALSRNVNREFVRSLYVRVLGRTPVGSSGEVDYWVAAIKAGATREQVAAGFLYAGEHLVGVVNGYYQAYLRRPADPAGLAEWVSAIQGGRRDEQVVSEIVASPEYRASV